MALPAIWDLLYATPECTECIWLKFNEGSVVLNAEYSLLIITTLGSKKAVKISSSCAYLILPKGFNLNYSRRVVVLIKMIWAALREKDYSDSPWFPLARPLGWGFPLAYHWRQRIAQVMFVYAIKALFPWHVSFIDPYIQWVYLCLGRCMSSPVLLFICARLSTSMSFPMDSYHCYSSCMCSTVYKIIM